MNKKEFFRDFELNMGYHFGALLNKAIVKPHWIYISLLHKCNLNCKMCGVSKIMREHQLSLKQVKNILDEVASWKSNSRIQLTGGEPFLRKDIFEIINYSTSKGLVTEVVSNGGLISGEMAKKIINSDLWGIEISIDGSTPKTHDYIRGVAGSHKRALNSLKMLVKEKKKRGKGPQISIWTTIMEQNISELEEIARIGKEIGVDCIVYHPVILSQTDMQNTKQEGSMWVPEEKLPALKKEIDKLVDFQKKNGLIAFLHDPYWFIKYFDKTIRKTNWKCNPLEFVDVGPNGFVQSCGGDFGSIKNMTLAETLNTKKAEKSRELMKICTKPCLQTCWARPSADSLKKIFDKLYKDLDNSKISEKEKEKYLKKSLEILEKYENMVKEELKK
ncbi:radical SAM protein [Bacteroidota bacterium]